MVGAGDVQVGGALHRDRRWIAGVNERALMMNGCGRGGSRKEGETNNSEKYRRKRWGRRARLKVLSISNERLGEEGSMSEVGVPQPQNRTNLTHRWLEITTCYYQKNIQ